PGLEQAFGRREELGAVVALQLHLERRILAVGDGQRLADRDEIGRLDLHPPLAGLDVLRRELAVLLGRGEEAVVRRREDERHSGLADALAGLVEDLARDRRVAAPGRHRGVSSHRIAAAHPAAALTKRERRRQEDDGHGDDDRTNWKPHANLGMKNDDRPAGRSEEHTSELQSLTNIVCRLLLEKKKSTHLTTTQSAS